MNPRYLEDTDLAAATFGDLFAELHARGDAPPIPVGSTLQRYFDGHALVPSRRSARIGRGPLIGLAVAGTLAGGLGAAAANELPQPLQRAVSTVVNKVTPFTIETGSAPEPADPPVTPAVTSAPSDPPGNSSEVDEDDDSSADDSEGDQSSSSSKSGESDDDGAVSESDSETDGHEDSEAEHSASDEDDSSDESDDSSDDAQSSDDESEDEGSTDEESDDGGDD